MTTLQLVESETFNGSNASCREADEVIVARITVNGGCNDEAAVAGYPEGAPAVAVLNHSGCLIVRQLSHEWSIIAIIAVEDRSLRITIKYV